MENMEPRDGGREPGPVTLLAWLDQASLETSNTPVLFSYYTAH